MKQFRWYLIGLAILLLLGSLGLGVYNFVKPNSDPPTNAELTSLQISFMKTYGTSATVTQIISDPKTYEIAWKGSDGSSNVSENVGGVWVLIASVPATSTTSSP